MMVKKFAPVFLYLIFVNCAFTRIIGRSSSVNYDDDVYETYSDLSAERRKVPGDRKTYDLYYDKGDYDGYEIANNKEGGRKIASDSAPNRDRYYDAPSVASLPGMKSFRSKATDVGPLDEYDYTYVTNVLPGQKQLPDETVRSNSENSAKTVGKVNDDKEQDEVESVPPPKLRSFGESDISTNKLSKRKQKKHDRSDLGTAQDVKTSHTKDKHMRDDVKDTDDQNKRKNPCQNAVSQKDLIFDSKLKRTPKRRGKITADMSSWNGMKLPTNRNIKNWSAKQKISEAKEPSSQQILAYTKKAKYSTENPFISEEKTTGYINANHKNGVHETRHNKPLTKMNNTLNNNSKLNGLQSEIGLGYTVSQTEQTQDKQDINLSNQQKPVLHKILEQLPGGRPTIGNQPATQKPINAPSGSQGPVLQKISEQPPGGQQTTGPATQKPINALSGSQGPALQQSLEQLPGGQQTTGSATQKPINAPLGSQGPALQTVLEQLQVGQPTLRKKSATQSSPHAQSNTNRLNLPLALKQPQASQSFTDNQILNQNPVDAISSSQGTVLQPFSEQLQGTQPTIGKLLAIKRPIVVISETQQPLGTVLKENEISLPVNSNSTSVPKTEYSKFPFYAMINEKIDKTLDDVFQIIINFLSNATRDSKSIHNASQQQNHVSQVKCPVTAEGYATGFRTRRSISRRNLYPFTKFHRDTKPNEYNSRTHLSKLDRDNLLRIMSAVELIKAQLDEMDLAKRVGNGPVEGNETVRKSHHEEMTLTDSANKSKIESLEIKGNVTHEHSSDSSNKTERVVRNIKQPSHEDGQQQESQHHQSPDITGSKNEVSSELPVHEPFPRANDSQQHPPLKNIASNHHLSTESDDSDAQFSPEKDNLHQQSSSGAHKSHHPSSAAHKSDPPTSSHKEPDSNTKIENSSKNTPVNSLRLCMTETSNNGALELPLANLQHDNNREELKAIRKNLHSIVSMLEKGLNSILDQEQDFSNIEETDIKANRDQLFLLQASMTNKFDELKADIKDILKPQNKLDTAPNDSLESEKDKLKQIGQQQPDQYDNLNISVGQISGDFSKANPESSTFKSQNLKMLGLATENYGNNKLSNDALELSHGLSNYYYDNIIQPQETGTKTQSLATDTVLNEEGRDGHESMTLSPSPLRLAQQKSANIVHLDNSAKATKEHGMSSSNTQAGQQEHAQSSGATEAINGSKRKLIEKIKLLQSVRDTGGFNRNYGYNIPKANSYVYPREGLA